MAQPKAKVTPSKKKSPPKHMLEVEDAGSQEEFLKKARFVWNREHGFGELGSRELRRRRRGKGRPSNLSKIIRIFFDALEKGTITKKTTQGKLIIFIQKTLGDKCPHPDTVKKFAKFWKEACTYGPDGFDFVDDNEWYQKKNLAEAYHELICEIDEINRARQNT